MRKALIAATLATLTVSTGLLTEAAEAHGRGRGRGPEYHHTDNGIRYWRGNDGRYRCRKSNGTTGLLVGAGAGALLGREVDRNNSRPRCR